MFKNETLVKLVVCTLLALPVNVWGQTPPAPVTPPAAPIVNFPSTPANCSAESAQVIRDRDAFQAYDAGASGNTQTRKDELKKNWDDAQAELTRCRQSSTAGGCTNAPSEYDKAKTEFRTSCRSLPQTGGNIGGNIACGWNIERCQCRGLSAGGVKYEALKCEDAPSGPFTPSSPGEKDGRHLPTCNIAAASDLDKLEKEVRDAQKELRELERKIPELDQQIADAQSQMNEKIQQAEQQGVDAQKARIQQRADAVKAQREAIRTAAQEVVQLRQQISTLEEERIQLGSSRQRAELERQKGQAAVRNNCHAQAIKDVGAKQAEALALQQGRAYNRGSFNQMLRNVGVSSRTQWQRLAAELYKQCMQSAPTRDAVKMINQEYNAVLDQANGKERSLGERRRAIEVQIAQVEGGVCNPAGGSGVSPTGTATESRSCQAVRQFSEDVAKAEAEYINQQRANAKAENRARSDGAARLAAKTKERNLAERTLFEERQRLRNLRNFLALKQQHAPGNMDGRDMENALAKHAGLIDKSRFLIHCAVQDNKNCEGPCAEAFEYMRAIGEVTPGARPFQQGGTRDQQNWWGGSR